MTKAEIKLLEKVFEAEINGALNRTFRLYQTKSKALADKLVKDGLLVESEVVFGGRSPVTVKGYELTELGRLTYCMSVKQFCGI